MRFRKQRGNKEKSNVVKLLTCFEIKRRCLLREDDKQKKAGQDKNELWLHLSKRPTCEGADIYQTFQTVITKHNGIIAAVVFFLSALPPTDNMVVRTSFKPGLCKHVSALVFVY